MIVELVPHEQNKVSSQAFKQKAQSDILNTYSSNRGSGCLLAP